MNNCSKKVKKREARSWLEFNETAAICHHKQVWSSCIYERNKNKKKKQKQKEKRKMIKESNAKQQQQQDGGQKVKCRLQVDTRRSVLREPCRASRFAQLIVIGFIVCYQQHYQAIHWANAQEYELVEPQRTITQADSILALANLYPEPTRCEHQQAATSASNEPLDQAASALDDNSERLQFSLPNAHQPAGTTLQASSPQVDDAHQQQQQLVQTLEPADQLVSAESKRDSEEGVAASGQNPLVELASSAGLDFPVEQVMPVGLIAGPLMSQADELLSAQQQQQHQTSGSSSDGGAADGQSAQHGNERRNVDISLVQSAAKRPPVYMSAPKQISELNEIHKPDSPATATATSGHELDQAARRSEDLHTAAGHYKSTSKKKKKKKKKKIVIVKKQKKKKKKKKKKKHVHKYVYKIKEKKKKPKKPKKKKIVKKVVKVKEYNHHHHHHHHSSGGAHHTPKSYSSGKDHGKYYEYRAVPHKGSWKFGYRRGNKKHTIERKEHGHKSHFKTEVKWKDKKGKGHHVFDYNHSDHKKGKKHDYHHAAASKAKASTSADQTQPAAAATGEQVTTAANEQAASAPEPTRVEQAPAVEGSSEAVSAAANIEVERNHKQSEIGLETAKGKVADTSKN